MSQNRVLVLDHQKQPLMPCRPARARQLLKQQKAAVFRRFPFTIILKQPTTSYTQPLRFKADPGSRTTGLALVATYKRGQVCIFAAELHHRGLQIKKGLQKRSGVRRSRRFRHTPYRKPRFDNRTSPKGWLPPSLYSRVNNVLSWAMRFQRWTPLTDLSVESVRFDTQRLQSPEVSGVEYQQGTLFGYEVKEYLLEKWDRRCAYCKVTEVPLQIEHMVPKSRGGSNRVSNLTLACAPCNQNKGNKTAEEFGHGHLMEAAKKPLRDAAAVNSTRKALVEGLSKLGLPLECGSGGQTKYNRTLQGYEKTHWLDAVCIGHSGSHVLANPGQQVLEIHAMGRGSRQMCKVDKHGFPRTKAKAKKKGVHGFQTGDMVKAVVTKGKKMGTYVGRVAVRKSGSFNIKTTSGTVQGVSHRFCRCLQRVDGYAYLL